MASKDDAYETIRFAILNALIGQMPRGAHPYLRQVSEVATKALKDPSYAWVFSTLAEKPA